MATSSGRATKNVVTADAMKELQMRMKARADERRNQIDGRHQHLFGRLALILGKSEEWIEECAIADERWHLIDEFFNPGGRRLVMWFHQERVPSGDAPSSGRSEAQSSLQAAGKEPEKKFFLTTGHEERLTGRAYFFQKLKSETAITVRNVHETLYNSIEADGPGGVLQGFEIYLSRIMLPHLRAQKDWGQLSHMGRAGQNKINHFLESVDRFIQCLRSSQKSIAAAFKLEEPDIGYNLDVALSEYGGENISAVGNSDFIEKLEELVKIWCRQINEVLTESEQIRKEADDIGPSAELDHWKQRMTKFNSLLSAISVKRVKLIIETLVQHKSKVIKTWIELDRRVSDAANEAEDNVKYLSTLDQYLGPLSTSDPVAMRELLPNLINSIRMIHTISRYYNTSERMTSLFVKVTNQMIKSCRNYIMQGSSGKIWDQNEDDVLARIDACIALNDEYQEQFRRARERLREESEKLPGKEKRHFDFSENYIFGKLDNFCRRLGAIREIITKLRIFNRLHELRMDGIDEHVKRLDAIESNIKMRPNELDYRKVEWDNSFKEFKSAIERLEGDLQNFLRNWIEKPVPTCQVFEIFEHFQPLEGDINLGLMDSYQELLRRYTKQDIEHIRKIYNKQKGDPPGPRNYPTVSSRIAWSRQLYRRINDPMEYARVLNDKFDILRTKDGKFCVKNYNAVATALVEYETMYHQVWVKAAEQAKKGLKGSLFVRSGAEKEFELNFDLDIYQIAREGRYMKKIGLDVPDSAEELLIQEDRLRSYHKGLAQVLDAFEEIKDMIPPMQPNSPPMAPYMKFFIKRVENVLRHGAALLTWDSLNVPSFIDDCNSTIDKTKALFTRIQDILDCRIETTLKKMGDTMLIELPEEPLRCEKFLELTEAHVKGVAEVFVQASANAESYVMELVKLLEENFEPHEMEKLEHAAKTEHNPVWYYNLTAYFCGRNTDAFVRSTRNSLELLKKRLSQSSLRYGAAGGQDKAAKAPLIISDITLAIPQVVFNPTLDDIQHVVQQIIDHVLSVCKDVKLWEQFELYKQHQEIEQEAAKKRGEDKLKIIQNPKPFDKQLRDHKDVIKSIIPLNTVISSLKTDSDSLLSSFADYKELWEIEPAEKVRRFEDEKPLFSDYGNKIRHFVKLEEEVQEIPTDHKLGPIRFETDSLRLALATECKNWKREFAKALNRKAAADMDQIFETIEDQKKRLGRPINDLDDIRSSMSALKELREAEIGIDMNIGPIEESYALLNRFELTFDDGNVERVDSIGYAWKNVQQQSVDVQNQLIKVQPEFKQNLTAGVAKFKEDTAKFYIDFDQEGPLVEGIKPAEASDRVTVFQSRFDELWRKYLTYSGGEELFGMVITEYPDLQRIRKELNLLQKLYGLYNQVLESVAGYYDILWADLNIESINEQLLDFQNRCRKLPKGLKEWEAFLVLKAKIDDFSESCPLLEQMSHPAMLRRHWDRIERMTKCTFEVENENFALRNVMEAPLLEHREDLEDICISAVKEKDIESKLKQVMGEWENQDLTFAPFKTRGELLLKGADISEIVVLLEDSLMVLSSLMSNRYNAPFKPKIQEWVHKLSGSTEIIEQWLQVQNLWVYLEAVFVGGDIAKQLPQEAKRFGNIDKSWQKIMQKAHETTNVVKCCTGDDMLSQLLPHLLEQLEICQKSLTGYLEAKRLLFPRFFFVSDPALLEILGQASDPHTIQPHLLSLFDNVNRVKFDAKVYDKILTMVSQEGEEVDLQPAVLCQGSVEVWLKVLLDTVLGTVHKIVKRAWMNLGDSGFDLLQFEDNFPAQIGLLGIQLLWTRDAEEALANAKYDRSIMEKTNQSFLDLLNTLIDQTTKELTKMERVKYETLITIHVHQRDIFDEMCQKRVRGTNDFEWQKQCRFYYDEDFDKCRISVTDVDFTYCDEYTGCTDRLVITPLTDRCYITLAQALGMDLGGAPAGPAGTGKTETTKDMGKCLGKYVVVFNCSDQMDFRGLGRIYKGLAQSGSWGCFDEFNRIELPVLSVAAQQIAVILQCKKMKKTQFIFTDGDTVDMNPEFGLFITMNPGYAGRQELPENLKIMFRSCAMMVPDRQIIMRVKLASAGFKENLPLSFKFYTLYKLCEEQLSKQVHYDFGLRNILSVLRTLGAEKRKNPGDPEIKTVMRVLRDMNLSKLVDEDEPLFLSLIDDLFPNIKLETAGYPKLEEEINMHTLDSGLTVWDPWKLKLIQLYETQRVRHGMMVLGPSGAGKTKCIAVLMKAMGSANDPGPHKEMRMNPKAITASQMFGTLDVATNDWTDGIFSTLWRRSHKTKKGEHLWLVLDGPVDAIWIENLNSVLDDNKTLTLANGDRIPMAPNTKIVFEPHNIDNASPATVSRNGMVFMSSSALTWKPILEAWTRTLPASQQTAIDSRYDIGWEDTLQFVITSCHPKMDVLDCMYIRQSIDIFKGLLPENNEEFAKLTDDHVKHYFVFAVMWSLGALLELNDREKLESFWREHDGMKPLLPACEGSQTIFEFVVNASGQWENWSKRVDLYDYPKDSVPDFNSILVPNVDNVRTDFLMHLIMKQSKAVLLIGEQGTAKTVMIQGYCKRYDIERHVTKSLNFSSTTTPQMYQRTIESYVDKRVGTTFGPPAGKKMTVFIDDINMPIINEWKDQVTNEIVRQLCENGGFYNLDKPGDFINIVDVQFVAAMIHPGGGRNDIPQRLKRQFNIFNCTLPSNTSIDQIFTTIGNGYFVPDRGFDSSVTQMVDKIVPVTRLLWQKTKVKMLPTPDKFHYIFNLRDLSRIWQGILTVKSEECQSAIEIINLWRHECTRTIADRFVSQKDRDWFQETLKELVGEHLGEGVQSQMNPEPFYVDFLREAPEPTGEEPDDFDFSAPKIYELTSLETLYEKLLEYQEQYNENIRGAKMGLVFFKDAMTHMVKISRIIRTPRGAAMLVGVGGSGKQSLTRLATFIAGYTTFQITLSKSYGVNNLLEDLKVMYRMAGKQGKGVTFLFTDNEIKDESFLEYLNNVIATGEVSNLFARDEMDEMLQELVPVMKAEMPRHPPTNENLYEYFITRVRNNLHVVLCFSPVGEQFRRRSLMFPGLFSGCTMDWFFRWPKEALVQVAENFMNDPTFKIETTDEIKEQLVDVMGQIQDMVSEVCDQYFDRYRRRCHVTPKSYLSFLLGYKDLYAKKLVEVSHLRDRMTTGLLKLAEAEESVNELAIELEQKEKDLAVASAEAEVVLKEVTAKSTEAEKIKAGVQIVKDKAQAIVDSIAADKSVAEAKLEAAKPALQAAEDALKTITPNDIANVKKLGKPPHLIKRILDCVLILMGKQLDPVTPDEEKGIGPTPSWSHAVRLMNDPKFLTNLLYFEKDTITDEMVDMLQVYFREEDYNLESAKRVSSNVAGLCTWTQAMASFFAINKEVLPLKANLAIAEAKLEKANAELADAQGKLDAAQASLDAANAQYDEAMAHKQALIDDAEACKKKMSNASALIDGLGGEKIRWREAEIEFNDQIRRLVGDVLMATGFLSYSGPFNQEFRSKLIDGWQKKMTLHDIPFTESLKLIDMLADAPTIGEWNLQGLPSDELSTQNGIIVTSATRFPLLIDPQGQGKIWITNREAKNDLKVTNLNHKYFRTHLEDALANGQPLLIEDVGEDIDPALDNVLEKNFIKSGSTLKVKVGDKECDVAPSFRLYLTTKLANPAYTPEVYARTSIIDFTVTMKGLEDQLLARVILTEKAELELERVALLEDVTNNKRKLSDLENNLLNRLTSTTGSLVDDDELIEVLRISKITSAEVNEKLEVAAETQTKIGNAREEYRPVAFRGSIMYFLIVEMSLVNVMYQTSLKQFLVQFDFALARSSKSPIAAKRIANIIEYLTLNVFLYTARGFYEQDKFLYALLLTLKIDKARGKISFEQFNTFIKGGASLDLNSVDPKPKKWILDSTWLNLVQLSRLPSFSQLLIQIGRNDKQWKAWFDSDAPEETPLPDGYEASLDVFSKTLLVRSWCPDRTLAQSRKYITDSMGERFADAVILNMDDMLKESDSRNPMICFLSLGSDPTELIEKLAKQNGVECRAISMGQGQEVHARRLLAQSFEDGGWLLLQNCHLGLDYMDELLQKVTETEQVNEKYRTWITTEPHKKFPINLLQSSIKYTAEPPQGLRAGLKRTYNTVTAETLELSNMIQWKPMLFCTAFLHSTVQERRKFGPLGWNIPYEFNQSDYNSAVQYVQNHLDDMDMKRGVNWQAVQYMFGEILYGGRVTDDLDKILLNTYCRAWLGQHMLDPDFKYHKTKTTVYHIPKAKNVQDYHDYIDALPLADTPEVFGLHGNADITYQTNTANSTLATIVSIQPKESGGSSGETREESVYRQATEMLEKTPPDFVKHEVQARLQKYGRFDPMNIFLRQEIDRLQRVITAVRSICSDLKLAIDGTIIMSEQMSDALNQIYDARIPAVWSKISWASSTLGFWFTELVDRHAQLSSWIFESRPNCFWLTGFFNPQGFLTAMRQEVTRAHASKGWALDAVKLTNDITKMMKEDVTSPPNPDVGGVYIYGLFLDGAGWDKKNTKLIESSPKVLFTALPVAHVYAVNSADTSGGHGGGGNKKAPTVFHYQCPVYKKPNRTDLTFIFNLALRTPVIPDHWTLRGVAALCDTK